MIETLLLTIPNELTYQNLKKPFTYKQDIHGVSAWALKFPLTIYTLDLAQKHQFMEGRVQISPVQNVSLEEKWKYFVLTKSDGRRIYCTSYVFYEKGHLKYEQSSLFILSRTSLILTEFYLPKCLVLISQKPYFKLQTNLIKIHRQLRNKNPFITQSISSTSLQQYQNQLQMKQSIFNNNQTQRLRASLVQSAVTIKSSAQYKGRGINIPTDILWNYYIACCNGSIYGEKKYVCPINRLEILHLYNISESLFRFNYFFHLPISITNLMIVLAAVFQEKQIIFASSNQNSNIMLMESILQMIHPLKWEYMYVPSLPSSMLEAAEQSFMPYMVGIHKKYLDKLTLSGRVIVHIQNDYVQMDEPILQLPKLLKSMLLFHNGQSNNLQYLDWEKQMRLKSILMICALLSESWQYEKKYHNGNDYKFYDYFFKKSALYQTFRQHLFKQANIQINELLWVPFEQKISIIQSRFNMLMRQATFPTICYNEKQLIKYYYHHYYTENRKSFRSIKKSLIVHPNQNIKMVKSIVSTNNIQPQYPVRKQIRARKDTIHRKGIQFVSTIKI